MLSKFYSKNIPLEKLRKLSETTREGSSLKSIANAAEEIGFRTIGVKINFEKLKIEAPLPCIVHWNQSHFIIVYKIKKDTVFVADPSYGLLKYTSEEFIKSWIGNNANTKTQEGICLLIEPTPKFYKSEYNNEQSTFGFKLLFKYVFQYKNFLWQLVIGLIVASLLQLIFPFLTQSIVDVGIKNQDIHFIYR